MRVEKGGKKEASKVKKKQQKKTTAHPRKSLVQPAIVTCSCELNGCFTVFFYYMVVSVSVREALL